MPFDTRSSPASPAASVEGVTGFYRFTDIFFEWHQALPNQDDVSPLKALLAYNALVHPDHPLRKPGVSGIELHLGTFENGEMRLLFSSAQIEYMRYYLHTIRLTKEAIPLPSSEYLIQPKDLVNISPDVYNDATVLKRAIKTIDKNNKRLKKGMDNMLGLRRLMFERVRTLWAARLGTWCAMDFEAWDRDHTLLTEFGWRLVRWVDEQPVKEHGHLIVKERRQYTQHYVPNNREFYNFGKSIDVSKEEFRDRICGIINKHREHGPLFLVFHDQSQDIKYLKSAAISAIERTDVLADSPMDGEIYVVDTAELFAALEGDSNNTRSLERICRHLKIDTSYLHNAGNDAYYTLEAMISMASGDPVDQQREQRWPNRTADNMPKVEFQEWEEDSDFSDMEGIFGVPVKGANAVAQPDADDDDF
ncbi:hypothetical protein L226DRAFT_529578 [Lentinus tigrinus ALCF2SS1-7]|uniref:Gfd2/YDR514C-like C-terminal domain-containing protein n=1 Tax=Lentinus tigrinus ALCF2SS1-6 TaxID=1328759 RepID=A0A5C2STL7_9APHY|nr:hypothetical protein L227DRAFT_648301 [Lentinus tigrinus ALCF2SS1-6]RPD81133.1 hypothetical protein L226DRAFT_529578 [Lentinus tigrinus ALCF2SS1-7]